MSRIIKAAHLTVENRKNHFTINQDNSLINDNSFTQDDAEILYEETRKIVMELINDAKKKSEEILRKSKKEAEDIIMQANMEAEKIANEAQLQGLEQGKEEGLDEVAHLKQKATEIIKETYLEREKILKNVENEIVDIAIKVSEKIIRNKLESDKTTVKLIATDLIKKFKENKTLILKVCERDYADINEELSEFQGVFAHGLLKIEMDKTLETGDCIVISENGIIEAKISEQLKKIKEAFLEVNTNAGF